ncbi:MAG: cupin domain-containing protein [Clostridiales bacterium]|jgi:mannose-6-phosphate isomerase-like protein (cupin superfamily)|nr:cupin domain-containing protein [Clostridiales bacterium]
MAVKIINLDQIEPTVLPGRNVQWLVTTGTIGAQKISANIMTCPKNSAVTCSHSHTDVEEVLFILKGEGQAWVDGEIGRFKKGDAVFFPANSKHQVKNTGDFDLVALCIFSAPDAVSSYVNHDYDAFSNEPK